MEKEYKIILASNSPRRKELLRQLDIDFTVKVLPDVTESYPKNLPVEEVPGYIAREKAEAYKSIISDDELIITADTVVILDDEVLGKPTDKENACAMLRKLSGRTHHVVTGVCLTAADKQVSFSVKTDVTFRQLKDFEINRYVDLYNPLDKAGAYGIQEWIGFIGITGINGSFYNVMGLPVQRIYQEILDF